MEEDKKPKASLQPKSEVKNAVDKYIGDSVKNAVEKQIKPGLKGVAKSFLIALVEGIFGRGNGGYSDYNGYSGATSYNKVNYNKAAPASSYYSGGGNTLSGYDFGLDRLIFEAGQDPRSWDDAKNAAERARDMCYSAIDRNGFLTVNAFFDICGCASAAPHTSDKWGWSFIDSIRIEKVRNGYRLNMPRIEPLT